MAAPLPILISDPNGRLTLSKTRAHCGIRSTSKNTRNEIIRHLRSWLQSVSRIRSFHCHRMRSESESQFTCAARLPVKIGSPETIRQPQEAEACEAVKVTARQVIFSQAFTLWS